MDQAITVVVFSSIALGASGFLCAFLITKPLVLRLQFGVPWIAGFTVFPLVVLFKSADSGTEVHEKSHWLQQRAWVIRCFGFVGLIMWLVCYFCLLPIAWNPLRRMWEREAFVAQGFSKEKADAILRRFPYMLWF